jgi:hypothetical protein
LWLLIIATASLLALTPIVQILLLIAVAHLLAIAIHEGGHLLAATRLRYRVSSVRIGPFKIAREYGRLRVSYGGNALDGQVDADPPDHRYAPGREAILAAAGPLANLGAALALHGLHLALKLLPTVGFGTTLRDLGSGAVEAVALWSGVIGVFNLVPFRTRRHTSDGAQLVGLLWRSWTLRRR